jgi:hypothetical protein
MSIDSTVARVADLRAVLRTEDVARANFRPTQTYRGGAYVPSVYVPSAGALNAALELSRLLGAPLARLY